MDTLAKVTCLLVLHVAGGEPDPGAQQVYPLPLGFNSKSLGNQYYLLRCNLLTCFGQIINTVNDGIEDLGDGLVDGIGEATDGIVEGGQAVFNGTGHLLGGTANGLGQAVAGGENLLGDAIEEGGTAIGNAENAVGQALGGKNKQRKQAVCFSTSGLFYFYCR